MKHSYGRWYQELHSSNPKVFSGSIDLEQADHIAELVRKHCASCLLDYGSGKGYQYLRYRVQDRWGGILPHCYDPGVIQLSYMPDGDFCGVICTDVLEHIAEEDLPLILDDIFKRATAFVYLGICCRPAGKTFPDGRNLHLTVKPPKWWDRLIYNRPSVKGLNVWIDYEYLRDNDL